jgi:hypothetical protein
MIFRSQGGPVAGTALRHLLMPCRSEREVLCVAAVSATA